MTIHFRSRIQTPVDYSSVLFPGTQGCCCTGPYPEYSAFSSSYGQCNALNGYFSISDSCTNVACFPQGITGCCCACAYGGATSGIEYSVCQDLDGVWQSGDCNPTPNCIKNGRGVTLPRACCGFTYDSNDNIISECFDVCTEKDCYALRLGGFSPTFYPTGGNCVILGPTCSAPQIAPMNDNRTDTFGNCCVQGTPCRCYKNMTNELCEGINGSFYLMGDPEFSCTDCLNNCSEIA